MDEWMDITQYRLDQFEKRADAADARMARIEETLTAIRSTMATKDNIRNLGLAVVIAVVATGLTVGAILLQSSSNQLSAFQAGLSAIQAVAAEQQLSQQQLSHPAPAPAPKSKPGA